jgi:hypothetical protein
MKKVLGILMMAILAVVIFASCEDKPEADAKPTLDPKGAIFVNIQRVQSADSTVVVTTMITHDEKGNVVDTYTTTHKIKTLSPVVEELATGDTNDDGDDITKPVKYNPLHAIFIDVK